MGQQKIETKNNVKKKFISFINLRVVMTINNWFKELREECKHLHNLDWRQYNG